MDDAVLELLLQQDWPDLSVRTLRYAQKKIQRLHWVTGSGPCPNLPGGLSSEDLAGEAIAKLWSGARTWDPVKQPELLKLLYDIVDSLVSHLVESSEHRIRKNEISPEVLDATPSPQSTNEKDEDAEQLFFAQALAALQDDAVLVQVFELCFDGVTKPAEIAEHLGLQPNQVSRLKEKMKRRLDGLRALLERGELV